MDWTHVKPEDFESMEEWIEAAASGRSIYGRFPQQHAHMPEEGMFFSRNSDGLVTDIHAPLDVCKMIQAKQSR